VLEARDCFIVVGFALERSNGILKLRDGIISLSPVRQLVERGDQKDQKLACQ
jgi:hypothetical protein